MDQRIDLDAAAEEIERHRAEWLRAGLQVGPVTWADGQTTVNEIATDRDQVRGDHSVGIRAQSGAAEGALVLYAGGWCDFEFWSGDPADKPVMEIPGWNDWLDLGRFTEVLDRLGGLLLDGE